MQWHWLKEGEAEIAHRGDWAGNGGVGLACSLASALLRCLLEQAAVVLASYEARMGLVRS